MFMSLSLADSHLPEYVKVATLMRRFRKDGDFVDFVNFAISVFKLGVKEICL